MLQRQLSLNYMVSGIASSEDCNIQRVVIPSTLIHNHKPFDIVFEISLEINNMRILSDNETKVDLLNNEAIAKTVVSVITESKNKPISIGIHGDWGAGKSSILEMIEADIQEAPKEDGKKYLCIRFNGWKHQGFEDSKVALMSTIVSELEKKEKISHKAGEAVKKLWKNINWMSVAKSAGKTALGIATGTAPLAVLSATLDTLKTKGTTEEGVESAIENIGTFLTDSKIFSDTSSNTEFAEFQKNFKEILEAANIAKLIVLIDDLDRCLPEVAIEILEAARLFMFTGETAFVIAADENMIRYAVKKHFPDAMDEINKTNIGENFANKYLEKLIQVPFRIPALGEVEATIYIMLLLVGSVLDEENENYKKLCKDGLERIKKPWDVKTYTIEDVSKILQTDYTGDVPKVVLIGAQTSKLLAKYTDGNPRKIKRFINMLLLRYQIAGNRGYGEDLKLPILAKMMLAEYYMPTFYQNLPSHLNNGKWDELSEVKQAIEESAESAESNGKEDWYSIDQIFSWVISEPDIAGEDLRPYYYACKERVDYFSTNSSGSDLNEIVDLLFRDKMVILGRLDDLRKLNEKEAEQVFDISTQKIIESWQNANEKPKGMEGLQELVKLNTQLRSKLIDFLSSVQISKYGAWALSGWNSIFPDGCAEREKFDKFINKLEQEGSEEVKRIAHSIRKN